MPPLHTSSIVSQMALGLLDLLSHTSCLVALVALCYTLYYYRTLLPRLLTIAIYVMLISMIYISVTDEIMFYSLANLVFTIILAVMYYISRLNHELTEQRSHNKQLMARTQELATELQKKNRMLEDKNNFMRHLMDSIPGFVFVRDSEGRFVFANMSIAKSYGLQHPREMIGFTDAHFMPDDLMTALRLRREDMNVLKMGKDSITPENEIRLPNGKVEWHFTIKKPIQVDDKWHVLGVSIDTTYAKELKDQLAQSELRYRELLELSDAVTIQTDKHGVITYASPSIINAVGVDRLDIVGQAWFDFIHLADRRNAKRMFSLWQMSGAGRAKKSNSYTCRLVHQRTLEERFYLWSLVFKFSPDNEFMFAILTGKDVTELKVAQHELAETNKALAQLNSAQTNLLDVATAYLQNQNGQRYLQHLSSA